MSEPEEGCDWAENRKFVLAALSELQDEVKGLRQDVQALAVLVSGLTVRASVWGAAAGLIVAALLSAVLRRFL